MKIFAVVVTYNRCELLKKAIYALKNQTFQLDTILVINNGSTDGTKKWLEEQDGLLVITQENLGGSGGFWRGIKEAYALGADYIWCMDDDVHPYDDCLEQYMRVMPEEGGILAPQRLLDGKDIVYGGECLHFNFFNPFATLKKDAMETDVNHADNTMSVEAIAFEGPIISRSVVEKIGLPERELFIFWDDTEYSYRAFKNHFQILYVKKAKFYKEDLLQKRMPSVKRSWKYPYMLRNEAYFVQKYTSFPFNLFLNTKLFCKYIGGLSYHLIKRDGKYNWIDFKILCQSFWDGIKGKLGKY